METVGLAPTPVATGQRSLSFGHPAAAPWSPRVRLPRPRPLPSGGDDEPWTDDDEPQEPDPEPGDFWIEPEEEWD
jgi:hypothetical protein